MVVRTTAMATVARLTLMGTATQVTVGLAVGRAAGPGQDSPLDLLLDTASSPLVLSSDAAHSLLDLSSDAGPSHLFGVCGVLGVKITNRVAALVAQPPTGHYVVTAGPVAASDRPRFSQPRMTGIRPPWRDYRIPSERVFDLDQNNKSCDGLSSAHPGMEFKIIAALMDGGVAIKMSS